MVLFPQSCEHLNSLATHPDLQVQKVVIDIDLARSVDTVTTQADIVSLLMMYSLRKICIYGKVVVAKKLNDGLVQGLHQRSHSSLPPLTKISNQICRKVQQTRLQDTLGDKLAKMLQFNEVLYHSWVSNSSRVQLKSLSLQIRETRHIQLLLVAQNLSFTSKDSDSEKYVYIIIIHLKAPSYIT